MWSVIIQFLTKSRYTTGETSVWQGKLSKLLWVRPICRGVLSKQQVWSPEINFSRSCSNNPWRSQSFDLVAHQARANSCKTSGSCQIVLLLQMFFALLRIQSACSHCKPQHFSKGTTIGIYSLWPQLIYYFKTFYKRISAFLSMVSLEKPNSNKAVNPEKLGQGRFLAAVSCAT